MSSKEVRRRVIEPEVVPRDSPDPWIEKLAWIMDSSIPFGRWRIGLDGIIGLVPGLGDLIGAAISAIIVVAGVQARLPRSAIARMVANVGIEAAIGIVPFLGDLFDMAFKANTRNVEIFRQALKGERSRKKDSLFVTGVVLAIVAIIAIPVIAIVLLVNQLS
ncbi:MAG TPA: DUF4112 domain-containing protein [Thermoanaerobaculia bacterium]|nr:DUF4112 domain-containing protein [Thermoanaerobaculia bacterium]